MYDFSVDYDAIDKSNILNIHKYLMIKISLKQCLDFLKTFIRLLTSLVSRSYHTKCESLSNQLTLINLYPNEHSQEFHYYPFVLKLDLCVGSCNNLNDLSNKAYVSNKTEDLNLYFNIISGKNESKILPKDISCEYKYKFDGIKCNSNQT